jgi:DNA-directed RNA polymerase subunit K/omega
MERLTNFEIARIIGTRATHIANGASPMIDTEGIVNPITIAEKEFSLGLIPLIIERTYPNGEKHSLKFVSKKRARDSLENIREENSGEDSEEEAESDSE